MLNQNNLCIFEGRLVSDPKMSDIKWTSNGQEKSTRKAEIVIAVDRKMTKTQKEIAAAQGKPTADFPRITVIGERASFIEKFFTKGRAIKVLAGFESVSWTDNATGEKKFGYQFVAEDVSFVVSDTKQNSSSNSFNNYQNDFSEGDLKEEDIVYNDDQMPF